MANPFVQKSWSPYLVGAGIGILSWLSFATADKPLGITTAFENSAALLGLALTAGDADDHAFYRESEHKIKIDWEWMLVLGVFIGAFISSRLSGDRGHPTVPPLWRWRFGGSIGLRLLAAFAGAALMMFGARLADGCTSGHGISGALQFALSSWIFVVVLFLSGIVFALLIYGREGRKHV